MAQTPPKGDTDEEIDPIIEIMDYWDFSPFQDEDSRRERVYREIKAYAAQREIEAEKSKDNAYWERNQLVAYLTSRFDSHMVRHPDADKTWEDDWRWIICIHTPAGQMTWHIHDSDIQTFGSIPVDPDGGHWDGHTTAEKYRRLSELKEWM